MVALIAKQTSAQSASQTFNLPLSLFRKAFLLFLSFFSRNTLPIMVYPCLLCQANFALSTEIGHTLVWKELSHGK